MLGGMIVELLTKVDSISQGFIFSGYQNFVSSYSTAIHALISLSVIVYGYAALQGWVSLSFAETSKRLLTIGFVLAFALNWGVFSSYIYDTFTKGPSEIGNHLIKSIPGTHFSDIGGINGALQKAWDDGMGFVSALWDHGSLFHSFAWLWAVITLILVILLVGISLVELIAAKFGMALFLVLAPLIIPMILFKATKEVVFDGWLKHLVTFALIPIFVISALVLGLTLLSDSANDITNAIRGDSFTISEAAPYSIFLFVCILLLIKSTHMAASMANGFSTGASNQVGNLMKKLTPKRKKR